MVPAISFPSQATQAISFLALPAIMAFLQPEVEMEVLPPPPPPPLPSQQEAFKKARMSGAQSWLDRTVAQASEEPMAEEPKAGAEEGPAGEEGGPAGEDHEAWPTSWEWLSDEKGGSLNFLYQEAIWIDFMAKEAKETATTAEEPFG
jgi:hypothetical protein